MLYFFLSGLSNILTLNFDSIHCSHSVKVIDISDYSDSLLVLRFTNLSSSMMLETDFYVKIGLIIHFYIQAFFNVTLSLKIE